MTREAHALILAQLLEAAADKATASGLLTQLSDDYAAALADTALLQGRADALTAENARLVEQNMKLFLKVGNVPEPETKEDEPAGLTFESLYKDLGLKLPEE